MKINVEIFQKFNAAFSVPVQLYCGQEILFSCQGCSFSPNPAYYFMKPYIGGRYSVCYVISPDFILSGYIALPDSEEYLIIGPASPYELSSRQGEKLLKEMKLSKHHLDGLLRYFHYLPKMSTSSFQNMLDFLNALIRPENHEEPIHLTYQVPHYNFKDAKVLQTDLEVNVSVENTLHQMITYGKVDEVSTYFDALDAASSVTMPEFSSDTVRSLKNTVITSTAITARHAIEGGLDYKTAMSLSDYYISKIESLTSFAEIRELLRAMILDFTRRVSLCTYADTDSFTVNAIYRDIQEHRYEKISSKDIANHLSLSNSYICHHFKEKTGKTLIEYIHEQKIKEAKYLLGTSELSLVLIAEKLGFSSQQQFQLIFKKVTGTTPNKFRHSASKISQI